MNNIEEKCMVLARQYCEFNTYKWPDDYSGKPDGFDEMTPKEKYESGLIDSEMRHIEKLITMETGIGSWFITNYYWNCHFREDKMNPDDWIRFAFFRTVKPST